MTRRATLGLAAALGIPPTVGGCATDGEWTVEKVLGWDDPIDRKPPKVTAASLATAERVETLGRRVIAQNTFTGLDPLFHTVGKSEPILFHRGTAELFVSDGLVKRCKTDGELAAVLCSELAVMMAEKQAAAATGRDSDGIPDIRPATAGTEVGTSGRATPNKAPPADPTALARDLLRGAGFDPAELDRVQPVLAAVDRRGAVEKQLAGSAVAPTWQK
ncbi:MAG: hypothetical protein K2X82_14335 [Gemmataceae bacterium]|nr:hypothetical protein [Gemmataceae bacterium]